MKTEVYPFVRYPTYLTVLLIATVILTGCVGLDSGAWDTGRDSGNDTAERNRTEVRERPPTNEIDVSDENKSKQFVSEFVNEQEAYSFGGISDLIVRSDEDIWRWNGSNFSAFVINESADGVVNSSGQKLGTRLFYRRDVYPSAIGSSDSAKYRVRMYVKDDEVYTKEGTPGSLRRWRKENIQDYRRNSPFFSRSTLDRSAWISALLNLSEVESVESTETSRGKAYALEISVPDESQRRVGRQVFLWPSVLKSDSQEPSRLYPEILRGARNGEGEVRSVSARVLVGENLEFVRSEMGVKFTVGVDAGRQGGNSSVTAEVNVTTELSDFDRPIRITVPENVKREAEDITVSEGRAVEAGTKKWRPISEYI